MNFDLDAIYFVLLKYLYSVLAISTFILLTCCGIYFGLNYSGFCFSKMRHLDEIEKYRSLFNYHNSRLGLPIKVRMATQYS